MRKLMFIVLLSCFSLIASAQKDRGGDLYIAAIKLRELSQDLLSEDYLKKHFKEKKIAINFDLNDKVAINDKRIQLYKEIINQYPASKDYINALSDLADMFYLKGNGKEAAVLYEKLIFLFDKKKIKRRGYESYYLRAGEYYHTIGEYQKAISYFEQMFKYNLYSCDINRSWACAEVNFEATEMLFYSYMSLNNTQKAFEVLLNPLFFQFCLGYDRYLEIVKFELTKRYSKKELQTQWDLAIENVYKKQFVEEGDTISNNYINYLNQEIIVPYVLTRLILEGCKECPADIKKGIKLSRFGEWIESL